MKRTIQAALGTFAIVLAREVAWRAAREMFRPRSPAMVKRKRKTKRLHSGL